jgi:hypothetical protein
MKSENEQKNRAATYQCQMVAEMVVDQEEEQFETQMQNPRTLWLSSKSSHLQGFAESWIFQHKAHNTPQEILICFYDCSMYYIQIHN